LTLTGLGRHCPPGSFNSIPLSTTSFLSIIRKMLNRNRLLAGLIGSVAIIGGLWLPQATAQNRPSGTFQGRGVAQGAVFSRGRNADVSLTLNGNNFGLEMTQFGGAHTQNQAPARIQYRGAVARRTNNSSGPNSFTLTTRVRSFDSSETLRIITNTTGTCRIEVFDARVIYSNCTTIAENSSARFLGLEQF
jgi:hypothetical protein